MGLAPLAFVSWSNKSSDFYLQSLHQCTPAHRVTLHPCNAHMFWTIPAHGHWTLLRMEAIPRCYTGMAEIASKVHRDLRTGKAWGLVFVVIPVTEGLRTPCDHLVMKKGLSYSTAAVWGHWWQADGFQKSTRSPGPCDSESSWCCNTRASPVSPRGMSLPFQECVSVWHPVSLSYHSPEIPAEHHQHQQNHVSSHTGLHQQYKLRLWAQSCGILVPCHKQCLKLPRPLILPKFKREITARHCPSFYQSIIIQIWLC